MTDDILVGDSLEQLKTLPMRDEEDTDLRASYPADPEPAKDENWTK